MGRSTRTGSRGFTIIELMVVLALIVILASLAMVQYRRTIIYSKEAVLRDDLTKMRDAIDQYYADKNQYPATLERARQRRLPSRDPERPDHRIERPLAGSAGRARLDQSRLPGPASTTSRAVRTEPLSTERAIRNGEGRFSSDLLPHGRNTEAVNGTPVEVVTSTTTI